MKYKHESLLYSDNQEKSSFFFLSGNNFLQAHNLYLEKDNQAGRESWFPQLQYSMLCVSPERPQKEVFSGPGVRKAHSSHRQKLPNTRKPPTMKLRAVIQKTKTS